MKKRINSLIAIVLIFALSLVGCGTSHKDGEADGEDTNLNVDGLNVWSYYGGFEEAKKQYEDKYNLKVNINEGVNLTYGNYIGTFLDAVADGNVPDVMIIDSNEFGIVNNLDIFENFFDEAYNIGTYREGFNDVAWEIGKTIDGKKMIGVAYSSAPVVTYYRQDIFKEAGLEYRPEELGEILKTKEGWESISKKLVDEKMMKVAQFVTDPFLLFTKQYSPFDEELNFQYTKENSKFVEILNVCKKIYDENYAMKEDFFEVKDIAVNEDYLAMVHLAPWALGEIKGVGGEKGEWAATRLPFGLNGWNASTILVIPKGSKNKKEAWDFIKMVSFEMQDTQSVGSVASYKPIRIDDNIKSDFLADEQMDQKLYTKLIDEHKTNRFITTLDRNALNICYNEINNGLENGFSIEKIIDNIEKTIKLKLQGQIDTLKESMSK